MDTHIRRPFMVLARSNGFEPTLHNPNIFACCVRWLLPMPGLFFPHSKAVEELWARFACYQQNVFKISPKRDFFILTFSAYSFSFLFFTLYLHSRVELENISYCYICGNQAIVVHRIHPRWQGGVPAFLQTHADEQALQSLYVPLELSELPDVVLCLSNHSHSCNNECKTVPQGSLCPTMAIYLGLVLLANGGGSPLLLSTSWHTFALTPCLIKHTCCPATCCTDSQQSINECELHRKSLIPMTLL